MLTEKNRMHLYKDVLDDYLNAGDDARVARRGELLSHVLMANDVLPDEVLRLHVAALEHLGKTISVEMMQSLRLLRDVFNGYQRAFDEMKVLKNRQKQLDKEIQIAAEIQKSLLKKQSPSYSHAAIGAITQPAREMSGDYYQVFTSEHDRLGVAIADVVGKGIPAAMCMSMIKYAMDSFPELDSYPDRMLTNLNRVVARNADPSMFVTMLCGFYDPNEHQFLYASAGHEPGFYYNAAEDQFSDLQAKGIALGIVQESSYTLYRQPVNAGDMIFLFTDGVTDSRCQDIFFGRDRLEQMIRCHLQLSAGQLAERIFYELEKFQNFTLYDDFTFIAIKF